MPCYSVILKNEFGRAVTTVTARSFDEAFELCGAIDPARLTFEHVRPLLFDECIILDPDGAERSYTHSDVFLRRAAGELLDAARHLVTALDHELVGALFNRTTLASIAVLDRAVRSAEGDSQ